MTHRHRPLCLAPAHSGGPAPPAAPATAASSPGSRTGGCGRLNIGFTPHLQQCWKTGHFSEASQVCLLPIVIVWSVPTQVLVVQTLDHLPGAWLFRPPTAKENYSSPS